MYLNRPKKTSLAFKGARFVHLKIILHLCEDTRGDDEMRRLKEQRARMNLSSKTVNELGEHETILRKN